MGNIVGQGRRKKLKSLRSLENAAYTGDSPPRKYVKSKLPSAPRYLSVSAKKEWRRVGKLLLKHNLISRLDFTAFAAYCQAYGLWVEIEERLNIFRQDGENIFSDKNNKEHASEIQQLLRLSQQMSTRVHKLLQEFGLSPSSRSKVPFEEETEDNPYEQWKEGKNDTSPAKK